MEAHPERLTFEHIKEKVESSYPQPIPAAFKRYRQAPTDDLTGRYKLLLDLFEVFIKFLCTIQLREGRKSIPNFAQALNSKHQSLSFLKRPTLGQWAELLRNLCTLELKGGKPFWSQKISDWYLKPKDSDSQWVVDVLREIGGSSSQKISGPPIWFICDSFPNRRNLFAHRPTPLDVAHEELISLVESVFAYVFDSASFLTEAHLLAPTKVDRTENYQFRIKAKLLNGIVDDDREFIHQDMLEPNWVYLASAVDGKISSPMVHLTPFFIWQHGNEKLHSQMFVFQQVEKGALTYASFSTGETHVDKSPVFNGLLNEITSLESQSAFDDGPYMNVPGEMRSNIARTLYTRALNLIDHGYYREAYKILQDAVSANKSPELLVTMAGVMIDLKKPLEEINDVLHESLKLDHDNDSAKRLLAKLAEEDFDEPREPLALADLPLRRTVFHYFCPRSLKKHAITFWSVLILGWYSASALVEFSNGYPERAAATTLAMLCCLAIVFGAALLRPWVERLRTPLERQLSEMPKHGFNEWFDGQLRMIFESFSPVTDSASAERSRKLRNRRVLFALGILWMVSMVGGAVFFSQAYLASAPLMIKRLLDYFVLFGVLYPAVQYTIGITLFVYEVSKLSLKPTLTKISNDGIRNLGPFVAFNIVFGTLIYSLLHLSFAIGFTNPFRIDLLFLSVGTGITAVWTIAFPYQLRRSLQASKNLAISKYSWHVEEAFDQFVEEPSQKNEENYKRLLNNERIIQKISVWPLSAAESVFIIGGSNLLLGLVAAAYVLHRLGLWGTVFHRF